MSAVRVTGAVLLRPQGDAEHARRHLASLLPAGFAADVGITRPRQTLVAQISATLPVHADLAADVWHRVVRHASAQMGVAEPRTDGPTVGEPDVTFADLPQMRRNRSVEADFEASVVFSFEIPRDTPYDVVAPAFLRGALGLNTVVTEGLAPSFVWAPGEPFRHVLRPHPRPDTWILTSRWSVPVLVDAVAKGASALNLRQVRGVPQHYAGVPRVAVPEQSLGGQPAAGVPARRGLTAWLRSAAHRPSH